jgi:hypothetical protein
VVVHASPLPVTEPFLVGDGAERGDAVFSNPHFGGFRWDDLENEESAQILWKIADDAKRRHSRTGNLSLCDASSEPASGLLCEDSQSSIWRMNVKVSLSSDLPPDFPVHSLTFVMVKVPSTTFVAKSLYRLFKQVVFVVSY